MKDEHEEKMSQLWTRYAWTAVQTGDAAGVRRMIGKGVDVNARDDKQHNMTLLHAAAYWGKTEVVSVLVDLHADLEARDEHGHTPLFNAVVSKELEALLEPVRRGKAMAALEAIRDQEGVSPDTYEVASKTLGDVLTVVVAEAEAAAVVEQ